MGRNSDTAVARRELQIQDEQEQRAKRKEARLARRQMQHDPAWEGNHADGPPVTELLGSRAGSLNPFGENHGFPLPVERLMYAHPTDKPNRAGLMAGETPEPFFPRPWRRR